MERRDKVLVIPYKWGNEYNFLTVQRGDDPKKHKHFPTSIVFQEDRTLDDAVDRILARKVGIARRDIIDIYSLCTFSFKGRQFTFDEHVYMVKVAPKARLLETNDTHRIKKWHPKDMALQILTFESNREYLSKALKHIYSRKGSGGGTYF